MQYNELGKTSLLVSRLCFGSLTIGPLQAKLPLDEGAYIIRAAFDAGVNFIDTAQMYATYPYIRKALADYKCSKSEKSESDIVIASKSYAYSYGKMRKSIEEACRELQREYIDIFLMHEQTSRLTLKGHGAALKCLIDAKRAGVIKAIGVSTHYIEVVKAAALIDEIDVIHPLINVKGIGIGDGGAEEMLKAIFEAHSMGKGIYTMKALGGGHLSNESAKAFEYLLPKSCITSIAVGMQSLREVEFNAAIFSEGKVNEANQKKFADIILRPRKLLVEDWCAGCGKCVQRCGSKALSLQDGKAVVAHERCVLCSYCGTVCPEFCLKII